MTPLTFMLAIFGVSIVAGILGSLLGLGGGIIVVPALALLVKIDIRYAIAASLISVIATSSGAGAVYVREHRANIRVAMFLELATTIGALGGAFLAGLLDASWLYVIFSILMAYAAVMMWRHGRGNRPASLPPDSIADALALHGRYPDDNHDRFIEYRVARSGAGFGVSLFAGVASGLLGIGGGIVKVPAMTVVMGIPMKAATATSNFMIGVTAAASAGVYFARGDVDPFIAAPTALGVLVGSLLGARWMRRVRGSALRLAFTIVLVIVALQMAKKGLGL